MTKKKQQKKKKKARPKNMRDEMFKKRLDTMEKKDKNLELEKALRNSPYRFQRPRKNW